MILKADPFEKWALKVLASSPSNHCI